MLSVINPSQMGGPTFPRPTNSAVVHGSSYNTSSSSTLSNRGSNVSSNGSACSVNSNLPFQARSNSSSSSSSGRNHQSSLNPTSSSTTSCNSFNPASAELFYFSSSSKNSTCSTTSSSTSCSTTRGVSQQNTNNLFSKPWNPPHIFHPGYRGFTPDQQQQQSQQNIPHSTSSACWLDCLSSTEKGSYPLNRRMSTNSSMSMSGYNIEQCRVQQQQEHELDKTRKRLSVNNSLFCNPSTSRVTNRPLPQPDGSSSKDFTKPLYVDCSIEYELPNAPKIPKNSEPILMIPPSIKAKKGECSNKTSPSASTSSTVNIKEEYGDTERASKLENGRKQGEDAGAKKSCTSSKCSCPEAVQYRKKYQLQIQQQKLHQEQKQKSFVKKEITSSCDNHMNPSKSFQPQCVPTAGSKRSYVQAMEDAENVEKRASNPNDEFTTTSAFQHPTSSDHNNFYSGNNSGNQLQRHRLQQQNQLGNSSRSGNVITTSSASSNTSSSNTTTCAANDSSTAFMDQLEYLSKCRSNSSDGTSNPPSAKRSRVAYSQQHNQDLQQRERRHRELQQHQQRAQQQETLRKQEAAVVIAHQQQREHFLHSMRARQHQERQAALSSLAAANLAAYRHPSTQQLTRYAGGTCCWPTYGGSQTHHPGSSTTISNASSRHQLHQMSSFQQITPPGSMPFCWAPGPAPPHHPSACPPTCCQSLNGTATGCRSAGCNTLFQSGRQHPSHGTYRHHDKASYGMDLVSARSKQAATMAAMACCYGASNQNSNLVPPPMACAATPALTGGNPNTVAAAAAAAAMAGAAYCLGCVQGKCQVTWNKENAVNNGIMRSL